MYCYKWSWLTVVELSIRTGRTMLSERHSTYLAISFQTKSSLYFRNTSIWQKRSLHSKSLSDNRKNTFSFKGTERNRTERNRTEQNGTEQNRTERNRTEQNGTEQNGTEQNGTEHNICWFHTVCSKYNWKSMENKRHSGKINREKSILL